MSCLNCTDPVCDGSTILSFSCKMQYWREKGVPAIVYAQGQQAFHDKPSIKEQEKQAIAEIRANGFEPERVPS